jgi:hypothetical protein
MANRSQGANGMSDEDLRIVIDDDERGGSPSPRRGGRESNEEMERRASASIANAARWRQEAAQSRLEAARTRIGAGLATVQNEEAAAKAEHEEALASGEYARVAESTARISEIEARKVRLQEHESALARVPVPPADPVEAYCATKTEPSAAWVRAHPDWVLDPRKNAKLTSAHWAAVAEGLEPDTSAYFEALEKKIGLRGGGDGGRRAVEGKYNRSDVSTHVLNNGRDVYLTQGEAARATDGTLVWNHGPRKGQPIGREEFARRKAAMIAQGYYNRVE